MIDLFPRVSWLRSFALLRYVVGKSKVSGRDRCVRYLSESSSAREKARANWTRERSPLLR